ncbi:MAG: hypothetical protein N3C57_00640 [Aquificaceae bacterium]|nr:hypothetical protein [Aquificaceae bacterium]
MPALWFKSPEKEGVSMKGKNLLLALFVAGGISSMYSCGGGGNTFDSLADKNSTEACKFQVSQDLDKGRYDAVLNSACATHMDRGAAYFGKAGFDVNDVIDRLIEAGGKQNVNSIDTYVKDLIPDDVNEDTLTYLDNAIREYTLAAGENPQSQSLLESQQVQASAVRDARFYRSIVSMARGVATIKVVTPVSTTNAGTNARPLSCDINRNNTPDDIEALACALYVQHSVNLTSAATSGACNVRDNLSYNYSTTTDFTLSNRPGTYKGITVNISGTPTTGCGSEYRLLFYKRQDNTYRLAATNSRSNQVCSIGNQQWPCPIIRNNNPLDFVDTVSNSFVRMVDDIARSIASTNPDLRREIERIKQDACGPVNPNECTADEIRNYINKITRR